MKERWKSQKKNVTKIKYNFNIFSVLDLPLYQCPRAAVTDYHKLSCLNNRNFISSQFWRLDKALDRAVLHLMVLGMGSSLPLSSLWWLLEILDILWLVAASSYSLPLSSCGILPHVLLSLCLLFLRGYQSLDLGSNLIYYNFILTNCICKDPASKLGHILRFWVHVYLMGRQLLNPLHLSNFLFYCVSI